MRHLANRSVWLLAAWAAVAVQAASPTLRHGCDRPCCGATAVPERATAAAVTDSAGEPSGCCSSCPATPAHVGRCPVEPSDQPCRCQLDARQGQPITPARGGSPRIDPAARADLPPTTVLESPPTLGVSREFLAAFLAVPIRPARILFGVWRN